MTSAKSVKPLSAFAAVTARGIDLILCDLDDTLTTGGKLPAASYAALEKLKDAGKRVIVVTGRPAGWCDMIARFWPVDGVVGENGAFYFRYTGGNMVRRFRYGDAQRTKDRKKLQLLFRNIRKHHPKLRLASDQVFRISDIAIDICEDIEPLKNEVVRDVVMRLERLGATVKVSSIHINAWIGGFDKLSMIGAMLKQEFGVDQDAARRRVVYVGDSPNDEPMFAHFRHTVGVRNVERFLPELKHRPAFITRAPGGEGFLEVARLLVSSRGRSRRSSSPGRH